MVEAWGIKDTKKRSKLTSSIDSILKSAEYDLRPEVNLKIFLLGDENVGKTSLVNKYLNSSIYKDKFTSDNRTYILQLWNVKGGECELPGFFPWRKQDYCYKEAIGGMFVYDVQCETSLHNIARYKEEFSVIMAQGERKSVPSILIGNKHDIGELDGTAVCQQLGIQKWFHVSAKTGENVEIAFGYLIKQMMKTQQDNINLSRLTSESFDSYDTTYPQVTECCTLL